MTKNAVFQPEQDGYEDVVDRVGSGLLPKESNPQSLELHHNNLIFGSVQKDDASLARAPYPIDWSGIQ